MTGPTHADERRGPAEHAAVTPELEARIVRCLDGELSEQERADLQRELLRNPAARRLMADSAEIDSLAAEALAAVVDRSGGDVRPRQASREAWVVRVAGGFLAAAAAVLLFILPPGPFRPRRPSVKDTPARVARGPEAPVASAGSQAAAGQDQPAAAGPHLPRRVRVPDGLRRGRRDLDRSYLGVYDEQEQRLYLFRMDRERTNVQWVAKEL